jgi:polyferredoxin
LTGAGKLWIFVTDLTNRRKQGIMERTKVLFATAPFDGHFNPLTTLALALQQIGYDVRWYTQEKYAPKLAKLQIPHFPFRNALQFHDGNMDELFPGRAAISGLVLAGSTLLITLLFGRVWCGWLWYSRF